MHNKFHLTKFWDYTYRDLAYSREPFNDSPSVVNWLLLGYQGPFTGFMCDMRNAQPTWNSRFLEIFSAKGWQDIGTSYYRMDTGTILPTHGDLYTKYINLFNLSGQEHRVFRAIVFLEDWQPGHYFEIDGVAWTNWCAGDGVEWEYNTPHAAANIGLTPRYTLQITGHL